MNNTDRIKNLPSQLPPKSESHLKSLPVILAIQSVLFLSLGYATYHCWGWIGALGALAGLLLGYWLYVKQVSKIEQSILSVETALFRISNGEFVETLDTLHPSFDNSRTFLSKIQSNIKKASEFSYNIGKGNFQLELVSAGENDLLSNSLLSMRDQLIKVAEEDSKRNWVTNGIAQLGDILRSNGSNEDLYDTIVSFLVKYTNSNQGGLFIMKEDKRHMELAAMYAFERKKYLNKEIELGEGLVGRAALEKDAILLTEIPNEYIQITSGLGKANPTSIFIMPLLINEEVHGVLELAAFKSYPDHYIDFVKRSAESIASVVSNTKIAERTTTLLRQSQEQTEMLRAQEEEVRQNLEEMAATQEELARKTQAIEEAAIESKCIMQAIDATMATIEFTPTGTVLCANSNFLRTMKCSQEDVKGKHHRIFVPEEIINQEDYKTFWNSLAKGEAKSGTFKRVNFKGEPVWLNAIYNPILNASGHVVKVVKFATDVTKERESIAEISGVLEGVNQTMATIEFTPTGYVLDANDNFLKTLKYGVDDIKGKHHRQFLPKELLESDEYKHFWSKLAAGQSNSGIFKRINSVGEVVWLNAVYNPIFNANKQVVKVVKFATDITSEKIKEAEIQQMLEETKAQEEELRQNMEELNATQEEMNKVLLEMQAQNNIINSVAIVSKTDLKGNITFVNEEFLKWSKYTREEVIGKNHRILKSGHQEDSLFKELWKTVSNGKIWRGEIKNKAKDGSYYWVDAIIAPVLDVNGKPKEFLAQRFVIQDKQG